MKNKLKKILLQIITLLLFSISIAVAQQVDNYNQGFRLGIGLNGGLPLNDPYDFNLGVDARLQYDLTKKYSLTFTTGFSNFFVSGSDNDLGYIPAKLGFKAFILKDQLYLMGEVGAAFAVTNSYDKTSLLLSPAIGYATKNIDISVRYEFFNNFPVQNNSSINDGLGQIALRLAYGFQL